VRHAAFIGLRSDKPALEIVREVPVATAAAATAAPQETKQSKPKRKSAGGNARTTHTDQTSVAGVALSHPSRVLFSESGLTKFDLAQYYEHVSEWILPHLKQRPLTLVRCPHGGGQKCFFQKHATDAVSAAIERVEVPSGSGTATYMMANTLPSLVSLVQMGVLELHTWGATSKHLEQPDRMIFDLDPAPDVAWPQIVEGAQLVKALLDEIGLISFVKTTGGKGVHVVVPLKPEKSWDEVKAFSRTFAEHMAHTLPTLFTANLSKKKRTGKIFIDYLRNAREATAVAAYSTRARPNAPVATPIRWNELTSELRSDTFNVANIGERLQGLTADPWQEFFTLKQRLTKKMVNAF
jgi:bifunctional non-homologous end joining protein LigD